MKKVLFALCLALAAFSLTPAPASAESLEKYIEMLRSDLRTTKTAILTEALEMSDDQATKFWPIQREYETELAKVQDARIAMIKDYGASFETMDAAKATALTTTAFKLADQRAALLKKYTGKVSKAVSPVMAARFAQVESFIQALVDVQVRGELPLVP